MIKEPRSRQIYNADYEKKGAILKLWIGEYKLNQLIMVLYITHTYE